MKNFRCQISLTLLILFALPLFAQDQQELALEKAKPTLHRFTPQQPKRVQLANGMVIFLQEDHELPLIYGTVNIRGGGRETPAAKTGMMSVYQSAWRTGGTTSKTGDQLDDFLEIRAAKVETGADVDSTSVSMSALKQDFDQVFDTFVDVLKNPEFRQDKVDLAKQRIKTSISRRNEEIGDIAGREAAKIGYGADNPYAREPEYWTIDAVSRQDLIAWHKRTVQPNNMILGIVGDFDSAAVEAKLRKVFESWPKGQAVEPAKVEFKQPVPGTYFAEKEDVNQSEIQLIALGIRRDNPDYYAIRVMNEMFGGAFASRLFNSIRSKQGLAYSVGGGVGSSFDHPGLFRLAMSTKSGTTVQAIHSLQAEVERLIKDPGSPDEIARAKKNILNSFIFEFDSKDKILDETIRYEFYGYPADYLERFRAGIEKVTPEDVARVVKKYVAPAKLAVLVVGKSADFDQALTTLGEVHKLDISIPDEPRSANGTTASATNAAASSSTPEGKALIAKVVAAMGGKEKLAGLKALSSTASQVRNGPQGSLTVDVDTTVVFPDQVKSTLHSPQGEMSMVFTPKEAFIAAPGQGSQDLPPAMKETAIKDTKRDPIYIAQHADDPTFSFRAAGTDKAGDKAANVLEVTSDSGTTRWLVDDEGRILRSQFKTNTMQGPVQREIEYADYRPVDGIVMAFKRTTKDNGEVAATTDVKTIKINPPVDAAMFAKPSD
jgi:zinc protease